MENRLEELFDRMVDEAPVMFTPKMKPYILEFARTYAREVAEKELEEGSKAAYINMVTLGQENLLQRTKSAYHTESKTEFTICKNSITNPKNIKLD